MSGLVWAQATPSDWLPPAMAAGLATMVLALWLMVPRTTNARRWTGAVVGVLSLGLFAASAPALSGWLAQGTFWVLAAVTLGSAAAAIAMRSAVYSALWFALSLLGTAGLYLFQGAEFLGFATVVVYAGAIVVTFLFVVMLAQPRGVATYDRISWGWVVKPISALTAASLVGVLGVSLRGLRQSSAAMAAATDPPADTSLGHVAGLGTEMFSRHLLSVEVAGTLLLVALVGAVAIIQHGRETSREVGPGEGNGDG